VIGVVHNVALNRVDALCQRIDAEFFEAFVVELLLPCFAC
jgi:hypothetical protein